MERRCRAAQCAAGHRQASALPPMSPASRLARREPRADRSPLPCTGCHHDARRENAGEKDALMTELTPRFRVESEFLAAMRSRAFRAMRLALLILAPLLIVRACAMTYVAPDQVGLRQ